MQDGFCAHENDGFSGPALRRGGVMTCAQVQVDQVGQSGENRPMCRFIWQVPKGLRFSSVDLIKSN